MSISPVALTRSKRYWPRFHADYTPGTCKWCRKPLKTYEGFSKPGAHGDGEFCGFSCSHQFAVTAVRCGILLDVESEVPEHPVIHHKVTLKDCKIVEGIAYGLDEEIPTDESEET